MLVVFTCLALSQVEPFALPSAEEKYSSEVAKAEAELVKAKAAAAASRLKAYKDRLAEETKAGNFDKAIAVKARVEQLEKDPDAERLIQAKRQKPKDTVRFQGHTYALIKEGVPWHVAKQRCEEMGGHLATFESRAEMEFVSSLCTTSDWTWAGATDEEEEGRWKWVTGKPLADTSWMFLDKQDDNHYLGFSRSERRWHDCFEEHRIPYVCEWDK